MWVIGAALVLAAAALLSAGPRSAVDWSSLRAVALESDDWGLAGFVPSAAAWDDLRREDLAPGNFPAIYWNSTLEDSAMVADLAGVLSACRGRDGLPAVMQPNYVMSSLSWQDGQWRRYDLPGVPPAYARPGLWNAVAAATEAGVWYPEFHATWHYDPQRRREATAASEVTAEAAERGIMLFPGSEAARELGPWRSTEELGQELDGALRIFAHAFGRAPGSMIAPDYTWDSRVERLWSERDLRVIQAKREQRDPGLPGGALGRVLKVLERQWSRALHADRIYLERNCRLEPVQSPDAGAVVAACAAETERAWSRGEPAIVETHRVNFAHDDREVAAAGRRALADYLDRVTRTGAGPVFVTDEEVAALLRRGTSSRRFGDGAVLRNGSGSRRVVSWPQGHPGGRAMRTLVILDSGFSGLSTAPRPAGLPDNEPVVTASDGEID